MKAFWALTNLTIKTALSKRMFWLTLSLAALLAILILMMATISLDQNTKIVIDFSLTGIPLLTIMISVVASAYLVLAEQERGTLLLLLTKPISRATFIISKYLGLLIAASITIFIISLMVLGSASFVYNLPLGSITLALYTSWLELAILLAGTVFFAALTTPIISTLLTFGIFVLGHQLNLIFFATSDKGQLVWLGKIIYYTLPNLEKYNLREIYSTANSLPSSFFGWATIYALIYVIIFNCLAWVLIRKREW